MKKRLLSFAIIVLTLIGCGNKEQTPKALDLEEATTALINSHPLSHNASQTLINNAKTIIKQSEEGGYGLINSKELNHLLEQSFPVILIDVSTKGNYLLGHIANAKSFELPKEIQSLNVTSPKIEDFKSQLGDNQEAFIVIYDEGNTLINPSAHSNLASLWAKKLGYNNVYKLTGGLKAWRERGYPLTQEKPQCCNHQ